MSIQGVDLPALGCSPSKDIASPETLRDLVGTPLDVTQKSQLKHIYRPTVAYQDVKELIIAGFSKAVSFDKA
ncbi:hypothetical protein AO369_1918 [Moraxella catarrhalis]|nr:hypothetical protein AO369_1918 [Moraxella catarrhalis]